MDVSDIALEKMRAATEKDPAMRWGAYRNEAFDSATFGHLQFLAVGPNNTYKDPPKQYPADTTSGMGWRYLFLGWVDLKTGEVDESQDDIHETG